MGFCEWVRRRGGDIVKLFVYLIQYLFLLSEIVNYYWEYLIALSELLIIIGNI